MLNSEANALILSGVGVGAIVIVDRGVRVGRGVLVAKGLCVEIFVGIWVEMGLTV